MTTTNSLNSSVLNHDFLVQRNQAGVGLFSFVNNQDTTSTAAAAVQFNQVAAPTGGDPYFVAAIDGTRGWCWGVSNQDSDVLRETTFPGGTAAPTFGTITRQVTTDGYQTLPKQPCFSAYKSANTLNATGNGTTVTVICDTEFLDQSGSYNNATGTFTAPVAGRYFMQATVAALNIGAAHTSGTAFFLVNGTTTYVGQSQNAGAMRELTGNSLNWLCHDTLDLAAGDTVVVRFVVSNSTLTVTLAGNAPPLITTRFGGWLIA